MPACKRPRVEPRVTVKVWDGHVATTRTMPDIADDMPQAEFTAKLELTTPFVFCYEGPHFNEDGSYDTYEGIGPGTLMGRILEFGSQDYPETLTLHLVSDTKDLLVELVLGDLGEHEDDATHSAWCTECNARVCTDDGECACYRCNQPSCVLVARASPSSRATTTTTAKTSARPATVISRNG